MFQAKVVEKIKTHISYSIHPPPLKKKSRGDNEIEEKHGTAKHATDYNRAHASCVLDT